ncbi:MAG: pilus assembly protein [Chloroflexi bacterium]|nr:pilus assembly protein [Chloroflexota bacterium]
MLRHRAGHTHERGQGLLEFALILPIFIVAMLGMIDVGRAIWANNAVANAAREAARFAAVHGGSKSNTCPVGPPAEKTEIPTPSSSCPYPSPSRQSIYDTATSFLIAGGSNVVIVACYGSGCSGDTDVCTGVPLTCATNARGTPVTVKVSSEVPMIMGTLLGLNPISVSATSTMLVNH